MPLICIQEVDRLDRLQPFLDDLGYAFQYAAGPNKKHGLMIAYKKSLFILVDQHTVQYDDYQFESARGGVSYRTTNIGFVVALKLTTGDAGVVVASKSNLASPTNCTNHSAKQAICSGTQGPSTYHSLSLNLI